MVLAASLLHRGLGEEIGSLTDKDVRLMVDAFVRDWRRRQNLSAYDDQGVLRFGAEFEQRWR